MTYLHDLDKEAMLRILQEPRNALTKQYTKLMEMEGVELVFEPGALVAIADLAIQRKTGARGLRSIMESAMRNTMFEVPSQTDIRQVIISRDTIEQQVDPELVVGDSSVEIKEA
jgi:ATP-dependent Clp protease ATP-binding subunit ClpX